MSQIRKLLIVPFFGPLPDWFPHWHDNVWTHLRPAGYELLLDTNEDEFRTRVRDRLGIDCPPMSGTGKIWDFRPALGVLYADEVADYAFWGHTDLDCVYGRVGEFVTDELLDGLDVFSNHADYVCGSWSLYRNRRAINRLYEQVDGWRERMADPIPSGWIETSYSHVMARQHTLGFLTKRWVTWQTSSFDRFDQVRWDGDRLMEGGVERMMIHFRRSKIYPEQLKR